MRLVFEFISLVVLCSSFSMIINARKLIPGMYVFGDSIVDVGNNNYLKFCLLKANFPHNGIDFPGKKPTGRYSNGKNVADFLAEKVGLATSPPYLSLVSKGKAFPITGVSFASGGAGIINTTNKDPDELIIQTIPLSKQVEYYSKVYQDLVRQLGSAKAQHHLSKSIFIFVIGSNDLLGYVESGSDLPVKTTPQHYVDSMLMTLKQELKRMHGFGARKYVVIGAGPVGCAPKIRSESKDGDQCNEEANQLAIKFNKGLKPMLHGLGSELNGLVQYSFIDEYNVFSPIIQNPSTVGPIIWNFGPLGPGLIFIAGEVLGYKYGFSEVKAACCGLGHLNADIPCLPISTYCSNRSDHLFWDVFHPTEAAARIFVDTIFYGSLQYAIPINVKQLIDA